MIKNHWKTVVALSLLTALVLFMVFDWGRFLSDFWPIDSSRVGPNLAASVVQYAIIAGVLYLLYPPFRRAVEKFMKGHVDSLREHISAEQKKLHGKLDHIIEFHPDHPEYQEKK